VPKKEKIGKVVSSKPNQTAVIEVVEYTPHSTYKKIIAKTKKYAANDPKNLCGEGDTVRIVENRPISKTKRWVLAEVVEKAK
jgi:small subunit ribosomal protein S17